MRRLIALSTLAALAAVVPAAAQEPPVPPPTPPPAQTPPPPPTPAPAGGNMSIVADHVGKQATILVRKHWRVRGQITPYAEGQTVVVRFFREGRKIAARRAAVKPGASGKAGHFIVKFKTNLPGRVTTRATKPATPAQIALKAGPARVLVLPSRVSNGAVGGGVRLLQARLRALGYVPGRRGVFDARTARAVLAFRKVSGLARTTIADRTVMRRLANGGGHFRIRFAGHGRHVEADLSRQVIALIDHKRIERIYPTSSGKPSTPTVLGHFRFYMKSPGFNAKGMYFSNYFIRGYAIHGYQDVPTYNASHGCLRIPNPDAYSVYKWVRLGDRIDVYA
jgi:peptidoglycan hydrolase-like protein with peptidoglycan-binding domain